MTAGYYEFEFDLPSALLERLISAFGAMESAELKHDNLQDIPDSQGVYQLFLSDELVYIGKTDADAGLARRLDRHSQKIRNRMNLSPSLVRFKAVRIFVFTAMDLESALIKHYAGNGGALAWNNSGFGSNDPGRQRDKTRIKEGNFDFDYPIDIDADIEIDFETGASAADVVQKLKMALPYTFRYETIGRTRQPHEELVSAKVSLPPKPYSARKLVVAVVGSLPNGWQATALKSHILLYRETEIYPDAEILAAS